MARMSEVSDRGHRDHFSGDSAPWQRWADCKSGGGGGLRAEVMHTDAHTSLQELKPTAQLRRDGCMRSCRTARVQQVPSFRGTTHKQVSAGVTPETESAQVTGVLLLNLDVSSGNGRTDTAGSCPDSRLICAGAAPQGACAERLFHR